MHQAHGPRQEAQLLLALPALVAPLRVAALAEHAVGDVAAAPRVAGRGPLQHKAGVVEVVHQVPGSGRRACRESFYFYINFYETCDMLMKRYERRGAE